MFDLNIVIMKLAIAQLLAEPVKCWRANQTFISLILMNEIPMLHSFHFLTKTW